MRRVKMRVVRVTFGWVACLAVLGCLAAFGCGRERRLQQRDGPVAMLSGRVRLADGAQLPGYASFDLARRPLHENQKDALPAECASANEAARAPVELSAQRLLAGVVVAASDFTHFRERKPKVHRVAISHCRLQPALIAASGGDVLMLENHDAYGFEPLIGPAFGARALAPGKKARIPLVAGGVESIICSRGAPCGRTDLVVFFHPVHAVTNAAGEFHIDNFPAAQLVRVTAWHPLFEPSETFVWLDPGERGAVELVLEPKKRFLPNP